MSSLLSDYQVFSGIYLSDPAATSLHEIRRDMEDVLRLDTKRLEKRLDETLEEIDSLPEERLGKFSLQGLIRGAYFAACALKTRSRVLLKQTEARKQKDKISGIIKACDTLQENLSKHELAPHCVKVARFSHRPFRKVLEEIASKRDEDLVNGTTTEKLGSGASWSDKKQVTNAAYLPI